MNERNSAKPASTMSGESALRLARPWRLALTALLVSQLAIVYFYRETALDMVRIWTRSETFTHGFLVPPISLWLIWRLRKSLARLTPCANAWALLAFVAAGLSWFLGELATVDVVSQFALTSMLVLAVPAVLGVPVARHIAFPLAFLFFAVPFGEFALPQLMEWTANFTVLGLRFSGIPVYREGLRFIIPSGSWSVVEACSGVRYLIASLCVGTLFAYLNYRSSKRRLIFVAVAFVVPVIANWLRAYMIVIIGHLSGNKLAMGVDHLVYGWVFFGMVIGAMFWIGSLWREDEFVEATKPSRQMSAGTLSRRAPLLAASAVILLASVWPLAQRWIELRLPPPLSRLEFPGAIAGWEATPESITDWTPRFEYTDARLTSAFASRERLVGLYLGYYRKQDSGHKMISSGNVLVTSTDRRWVKLAERAQSIALDQRSLVVRSAELRSVDSARLLVWQWYWVNGHLSASDFAAKAYTALSRLSGQGDDSAVIIVYAPIDQVGGGEAALHDFVRSAWPEIESVLRRAKASR